MTYLRRKRPLSIKNSSKPQHSGKTCNKRRDELIQVTRPDVNTTPDDDYKNKEQKTQRLMNETSDQFCTIKVAYRRPIIIADTTRKQKAQIHLSKPKQ